MSDQFLAEVRIVPFNFAPLGWALCNGQILPISQNTALFSLLGTNYGGNGTENFGLPNLQGSVPIHPGQGSGLSQRVLGEAGGEANITLLSSEIPQHTHGLQGSSSAGTSTDPTGNVYATPPSAPRKPAGKVYAAAAADTPMVAGGVLSAGGSQPHNNLQPYLVLNFVIAMQGIFPQRP